MSTDDVVSVSEPSKQALRYKFLRERLLSSTAADIDAVETVARSSSSPLSVGEVDKLMIRRAAVLRMRTMMSEELPSPPFVLTSEIAVLGAIVYSLIRSVGLGIGVILGFAMAFSAAKAGYKVVSRGRHHRSDLETRPRLGVGIFFVTFVLALGVGLIITPRPWATTIISVIAGGKSFEESLLVGALLVAPLIIYLVPISIIVLEAAVLMLVLPPALMRTARLKRDAARALAFGALLDAARAVRKMPDRRKMRWGTDAARHLSVAAKHIREGLPRKDLFPVSTQFVEYRTLCDEIAVRFENYIYRIYVVKNVDLGQVANDLVTDAVRLLRFEDGGLVGASRMGRGEERPLGWGLADSLGESVGRFIGIVIRKVLFGLLPGALPGLLLFAGSYYGLKLPSPIDSLAVAFSVVWFGLAALLTFDSGFVARLQTAQQFVSMASSLTGRGSKD